MWLNASWRVSVCHVSASARQEGHEVTLLGPRILSSSVHGVLLSWTRCFVGSREVSRVKGDVTVRCQLQAVNHEMALPAHRLCTKFLGYFWV